MKEPRRSWEIASGDPVAEAALREKLCCTPLFARLLVNRGICTAPDARAFLSPSLSDLADPLLLPDAAAAVERIRLALARRERISVHGDYDVDGVTSAALWTRLLQKLGADVSVHVPHRQRDGYDMRTDFITRSEADGIRLVITTDCGTQRVEEVALARAAGIDVIVTDHHETGDSLPDAVAVVNPQRHDSRYPFRELAGVGVAFRLGEALVHHLGLSGAAYRQAYADLAAIGTVADIMRLVGENRAIVSHGLHTLRATRKPGLRALMQVARVRSEAVSARTIGYALGPRLNAVGRMDDARVALDLLMTRDRPDADVLAQRLEDANLRRQQEQTRILEDAVQQVEAMDLESVGCLVLARPSWHPGIIGIVANKLVERYQRPTVLISLDEDTGLGHGSARSIRPFDMFRAVSACEDLLEEFGGHSHAAGISIRRENIAPFAERMERLAAEWLRPEDYVPCITVDAVVHPQEVTEDLVRSLARFEPHGRGNEEPVLVSRGMEVVGVQRIGKDRSHLKLRVTSDGMAPRDALMWGDGDREEQVRVGMRYDLCYRPSLNEYNGRTSVQYVVEDLRPSRR